DLDPPGAGARAPLLPRPQSAVRDDARPRGRRPRLRLGRRGRQAPRREAPPDARPPDRLGAEGTGVRRRHAGVPRLPRMAGEVDEARLAEVAGLDAAPPDRPAHQARAPRLDRRDRTAPELLQTVAGVSLSASRITSSCCATDDDRLLPDDAGPRRR